MSDIAESGVIKPRKPWLAALLSFLSGPLGQIYAGCLRRSLLLWALGAGMGLFIALVAARLPFQRAGAAVILIALVGYPAFLVFDAYRMARKHRNDPLKGYQRGWVYLVFFFAFALGNSLNALVIQTFLVESFGIFGDSMSPSILAGDRIVVDKFWYQPDEIQRNDLVVFRSAGPGSPLFVMRVIGLPGDEIQIKNEKVLLNGQEWEDPHADVDQTQFLHPELTNYGPTRIPGDSFFVLGDNRRLSKDSRIIGPIPLSDLHGKAFMIYWSRERHFPDPWDRSYYETGSVRWDRIGIRLD